MALAVVDASVAVKWFLQEDFSGEARRLRDDHAAGLVQLHAPSLLPYEVLNTARFSEAFSKGELEEIAGALEGLDIPLHSLEGRLSRSTLEVALAADLTIYDASYIALARRLEAGLYSADDGLLRAAGSAGLHIRDYRGPGEASEPEGRRRFQHPG